MQQKQQKPDPREVLHPCIYAYISPQQMCVFTRGFCMI